MHRRYGRRLLMATGVQAIGTKSIVSGFRTHRSAHRRSGGRYRHNPGTVELAGAAILDQPAYTPTLTPFLEREEDDPTKLQTL